MPKITIIKIIHFTIDFLLAGFYININILLPNCFDVNTKDLAAPFYKKSFRALNCPEALNLLFFIILLTLLTA